MNKENEIRKKEEELAAAKLIMRRLQAELDAIVLEIKASKDRSINTDKQAMTKNAEVSLAIQQVLAKEKELLNLNR
mgnify:CR=1 FL=1